MAKGFKSSITDDDRKMREMVRDLGKGPNHVDIGLFEEQGSELVEYAAENEFGASNVPARPFVRSTFDEKLEEVEKRLSKSTKDIIFSRSNKDREMKLMGRFMRDSIKVKILKGPFTPNAPSTIARKGSNKPLIDTGQMQKSITFKTGKK